MDEASVENALTRIEQALGRIERTATGHAGATASVEARHQRLRGAVTDALRQLDDLLGEARP